jgi:hypothetical protein
MSQAPAWRHEVGMRSYRAIRAISARVRAPLIAMLTLLAVTTACTRSQSQEGISSPLPSSAPSSTPAATTSLRPVTDYSSFIDGLEAAGFEVRQGGRTGGDRLFRSGRSVLIDDTRVSTYEYPSPTALDEFTASVSDDGSSIPARGGGIAIVQWSPPRFYAAGKLLVLYFGESQRTLDALELLMGPPFAGGTVR